MSSCYCPAKRDFGLCPKGPDWIHVVMLVLLTITTVWALAGCQAPPTPRHAFVQAEVRYSAANAAALRLYDHDYIDGETYDLIQEVRALAEPALEAWGQKVLADPEYTPDFAESAIDHVEALWDIVDRLLIQEPQNK